MRRLALLLTLLAALLLPTAASAHPLGNFTVNHYSRIEPAGDRVRIVYVLDMAEIPTFQEQPRVGPDPAAYGAARAEELRQQLLLTLDGQPAELRLEQHAISFPAGQGGLPTLRLDAVYTADLPGAGNRPVDLLFTDRNDPQRIGWREMIVTAGAADTRIEQSSVPATDVTDALRRYPEDLLNSPLDVREASATFTPGAAAARPLLSTGGLPVLDRTRSALADLASGSELTPGFVLFALGVATVLGMAHALQPGHGKTVVAAYLVGARGTARHAVFLGAIVTATHTAGVYALGLVTLFLGQYILPERLYPILEIGSGALVIAIGVWLFGRRLLAALGFRRPTAHPHPHAHDHGHGHGHDHGFAHDHTPGGGDAHHHEHPDDDHGQLPGNAARRSPERHLQPVTGGTHSHGGVAHSHTVPDHITWRGLLALGVSGGLLPCPEALMVLLITIAAHRVLFGLLLIVGFSTGLAAVLVGFGLLLVFARGFFQRLNVSSGLVPRLLPVASALVIVIAGMVITAQALPQVL